MQLPRIFSVPKSMDLKSMDLKRKRDWDTDDSAGSSISPSISPTSSEDSQSEYSASQSELQMAGYSVVCWDMSVDLRLLREMKAVRQRKGIYSYVRDWDNGWYELVKRLRRAPEFPDSLTKEQCIERIHDYILDVTQFDPKSLERPDGTFEGLVYDVFYDHELCSPLQAESRLPPPFPFSPTSRKRKPTSSTLALTSEEVVLKCEAIVKSYGPYLTDGQKMGFQNAREFNIYCNKIIAEQTRRSKEDFIEFLKETSDRFPMDQFCNSVVPETEAGTELPETEE